MLSLSLRFFGLLFMVACSIIGLFSTLDSDIPHLVRSPFDAFILLRLIFGFCLGLAFFCLGLALKIKNPD